MRLSSFFKLFLLGLACFAFTGMGYAEDADPNFALVSPQVKNICALAAKTSIPADDQPNAQQIPALKKCDPIALYYGINQSPNFTQARQCAFATQNYGMLAMIYANGKGVQRNWDLAIHFACKAGFAPDEIEGRVLHLVQLRDQNQAGNSPFDICDDITSGYMMGVCAEQKERLAQAERQRQLTALMASWSEADKKAWLPLQRAAEHFFAARSANEIDLSGTGRAAFEIEEQSSLQDDLLTSLQNLASGHFPVYTAGQAAQYDQQLNTVYREIQKNPGIKTTQLLWLKYRDAWVTFGETKYPQVDANSWVTWLTQKRIKMLQDSNTE